MDRKEQRNFSAVPATVPGSMQIFVIAAKQWGCSDVFFSENTGGTLYFLQKGSINKGGY
ncbi:MAG: hypothetical protein ACYCYR_03835 [Desulfobulbaceae bacterium]